MTKAKDPPPCEACWKALESFDIASDRIYGEVSDEFHHALLARREEELGEAKRLLRVAFDSAKSQVVGMTHAEWLISTHKFLAAHPPKEPKP